MIIVCPEMPCTLLRSMILCRNMRRPRTSKPTDTNFEVLQEFQVPPTEVYAAAAASIKDKKPMRSLATAASITPPWKLKRPRALWYFWSGSGMCLCEAPNLAYLSSSAKGGGVHCTCGADTLSDPAGDCCPAANLAYLSSSPKAGMCWEDVIFYGSSCVYLVHLDRCRS